MTKTVLMSLLIGSAGAGVVSAATLESQVITVTLDPAAQSLKGEGELVLSGPGSELSLSLGAPFTLDGAAYVDQKGKEKKLRIEGPLTPPRGPSGEAARVWVIKPPPQDWVHLRVKVRWSGSPPLLPENVKFSRDEVTGMSGGYLAAEGAFLPPSAGWYPTIEHDVVFFRLTARVPAAWRVVSEGGRTLNEVDPDGAWRREAFHPGAPLEGVHLVAAPWKVRESIGDPKVEVFSLPDTPDDLVWTYLRAAQDYIRRFTAEIGPHPWPQYTIAEHILPTGYGMPSFTLLGAGVIRLPFIVKTSLGHEVLHDWWGNGVYVDDSQGNWCEGLTAYMADHAFAGENTPGGDRAYRLQILRDYAEYFAGISSGQEPALHTFRERADRQDRALGYGKSAMVFHMLRKMTGDDLFRDTLRGFFHDFKYRKAGWNHLQERFSRALGRDLSWFFDQWVRRPGAPFLTLESATLRDSGPDYLLTVDVRVDGDWRLPVPFEVTGDDGKKVRSSADTSDGRMFTQMTLPFLPRTVGIDPDWDLFRRLPPGQLPATLARLLADLPDLVVIGTGRGEEFIQAGRSAANIVSEGKAPIRLDREVKPADLAGARRIWLIGRPGPEFAPQVLPRLPDGFVLGEKELRVQGSPAEGKGAAAVIVLDHPPLGAGALGIMDALVPADFLTTAQKMKHYGKYSWLLFSGGQVVVKVTAPPAEDPLVRSLALQEQNLE